MAGTSNSLASFVKATSPEIESVAHLEPLIGLLERASRGPVRACISVPPQHGKSTLAFHWLAQQMMGTKKLMYITYNTEFAQKQMRLARGIAERAGVPFKDSRALLSWYSSTGASLIASGIGGIITGIPGQLIVVDDPIKDWADAQSSTIRDYTHQWFRSSVLSRLHPGSSVIVVHTRWHPDDLSGRLINEGWEHINLPAVTDGVALWPEGRPIDFLDEQRKLVGEHIFAALYQGQPRPIGKEVFGPANFYDSRPTGYQLAVGVDFAYTSKTSSDYSVAVAMARRGDIYYVMDLVRQQTSLPEFGNRLKSMLSEYSGCRTRAYIGGTEQGVVDMLAKERVYVSTLPATKDKFVRAQPLAAAWNDGRVLIPRNMEWTTDMVNEFRMFTGVNDPHDDIVDAMASAYDELSLGAIDPTIGIIKPRSSAGLRGVY